MGRIFVVCARTKRPKDDKMPRVRVLSSTGDCAGKPGLKAGARGSGTQDHEAAAPRGETGQRATLTTGRRTRGGSVDSAGLNVKETLS